MDTENSVTERPWSGQRFSLMDLRALHERSRYTSGSDD